VRVAILSSTCLPPNASSGESSREKAGTKTHVFQWLEREKRHLAKQPEAIHLKTTNLRVGVRIPPGAPKNSMTYATEWKRGLGALRSLACPPRPPDRRGAIATREGRRETARSACAPSPDSISGRPAGSGTAAPVNATSDAVAHDDAPVTPCTIIISKYCPTRSVAKVSVVDCGASPA
jgi:hypothetical protein